jgi:hypothetical protein
LVTAGVDRVLRLWDTETLKMLPQVVQSAGKVDDMWLAPDGRQLIVHAGHWLHAIDLYASGLGLRNTRLLPTSPAAVQPTRDGSAAYLLLAAPGRPVVMRQPLDTALTDAASGDAGELRAYWRRRLAMTITVDGVIEPM